MEEKIQNAIKVLMECGVVAHPTETCYGLAADVFSEKAVLKLYALKKMDLGKPVSILVENLAEAKKYGEFSDVALELAEKYWPGPLTIIVPKRMRSGGTVNEASGTVLPNWVNPGNPTIGIRVSSHKSTAQIVRKFGGPITTTSANIHGLAQAYSVEEFLGQWLKPDFILDEGRIAAEPPSTIVEVVGDEVKVVREGRVKI